jgi:hypothetical protein
MTATTGMGYKESSHWGVKCWMVYIQIRNGSHHLASGRWAWKHRVVIERVGVGKRRNPNFKDNLLLAQCKNWYPASGLVKKYKKIRNIESFCSNEAAFVKFSSRIMPYVTTWAVDWQFTCYSKMFKGYWSKRNVGFYILFWLHVTPSMAQSQTPWLRSLYRMVGLWGTLLVFLHLQEKDVRVQC